MEKRLWDLLLEDSIITHEALEDGVRQQKETGESLVRTLIDMGAVTEWEMAATLGKQLNVPFITLSHYEIDQEVVNSIPEDIVRKYRIVPGDKTGDTLTIALADPSNIYLLDEIRLLTRCQIIPVISFETDILQAIDKYYLGQGNEMEEMLREISDKDVEVLAEVEVNGMGGDDDVNDLSVSGRLYRFGTGPLNRGKQSGIKMALHGSQGGQRLGITGREADAPSGHVECLGQRMKLDTYFLRPVDLQNAQGRRLEKDLAVSGVLCDEDIVLASERDSLLEECP